MGDRLRPYALVVLDECDEHDDERGWCVAEYDSGEELDRWMYVVGRCGYRTAHETWDRDRDGRPPAPPWSWSGRGEAMSDEELADAVGDVEEFVYGLWLELGEVRREARRGGRIGQGRLYDMALSTRWFVAARLWSLADGMEGGGSDDGCQ